jgi:hypothetical protein
MYACSSRMNKSICRKLGTRMPWNKEEMLEKSELRKSVMVRVVSVARKLLTIEDRCQDQSYLFRRGDYRDKATTPKICSGWSRVKNGFFSSETKHFITAPWPKLLASAGRSQKQGHNSENLYWVRVPVKIFFVARYVRKTYERWHEQSCFYRLGYYWKKKITQLRKLSWVRVRVKILHILGRSFVLVQKTTQHFRSWFCYRHQVSNLISWVHWTEIRFFQ